MRRKKLLTAALCAVLVLASYTVKTPVRNVGTVGMVVLADETEDSDSPGDSSEKSSDDSSSSGNPSDDSDGSGGSDGSDSSSGDAGSAGDDSGSVSDDSGGGSGDTGSGSGDLGESGSSGVSDSGSEGSGDSSGESGSSSESSEGSSEGSSESGSDSSGSISDSTQQGGTETASDSSTENGTESETLSSETTSDTESETETEEETDMEIQEEETESENDSPYSTNEELLAHQNIVIPPDIKLEFRFTQVDRVLAVVSDREGASVCESKSETAREVGELGYYGYCYILEDKGDGWYYIESGNVRGFIKSDAVVTGEVAERIAEVKGLEELSTARLLVARTENEAYDYTHTTTGEVIAEKVFAVASGEVSIYEQRKDSAQVTGVLSDQALCYILADEEKDWVYVESGDARGFVKSSQLITGLAAEAAVASVGENNMSLASVLIQPEDNSACYYTLTSVREASQAAKTREAIVNFALQFVGNPYVWGGTSLTGGADCSGFVQSIYAYFGYSLPRVASDQSCYGMQIPISSAEPGDLIFYAKNGYVYHVSMYIGDGQVVQAANSRSGIIVSGIGGDAVWAMRLISD